MWTEKSSFGEVHFYTGTFASPSLEEPQSVLTFVYKDFDWSFTMAISENFLMYFWSVYKKV